MPATQKNTDWVLTPSGRPAKRNKYEEIMQAFLDGGEDEVLIEGPITENLKITTLVTSLSQARKGRPVSVHRIGESVYLSKKQPK